MSAATKSPVFAPKLFHSSGVYCVYQLATHLFCLSMHVLSHLISLFYPTFHEEKNPMCFMWKTILLFPPYLVGTLLLMPVALVCGLVAALLEPYRRTPFRYSEHLLTGEPLVYKRQYSVGTSNVCLATEIVSKVNNLHQTRFRAGRVGEILSQRCGTALPSEERIIADLPDLDFVCFQEVWDLLHAETLLKHLRKRFRHVIYDVGSNRYQFALNSGLAFASKYPILDAQFKSFDNCIRQCRFSRKGLLSVKLLLGHDDQGRRHVAYISNTHLQAYQGKEPIQSLQLHQIREWTAQFKRATVQPTDWVDFDCVCGDFNIDNLSPVDSHSWGHPLFESYVDPARVQPGQEQPWTIGTEMRHRPLHDSVVASPEGLQVSLLGLHGSNPGQKALSDPRLRRRYVYDGNVQEVTFSFALEMPDLDDDGLPRLSPVGGRRRIDLVLLSREHPVTVKTYQFATALAGLTDHLLVCVSLQMRDAL